jgi:hypothetical protein
VTHGRGPPVADVTFLVNQIRDRDPGRGVLLEDEIRQAAGAVEPGETLQCRIYIDAVTGMETDIFFSVRIGQSGWARRLPPLSIDTPPMAVGLLLTRVLRRYRRTPFEEPPGH